MGKFKKLTKAEKVACDQKFEEYKEAGKNFIHRSELRNALVTFGVEITVEELQLLLTEFPKIEKDTFCTIVERCLKQNQQKLNEKPAAQENAISVRKVGGEDDEDPPACCLLA
mmetsp:Transcript_28117/g.38871  ORF Transcript_28117/g.38871 Transcript_28117/m.38871 type:complete len:113 (+) Transcript_28117:351-689(+)